MTTQTQTANAKAEKENAGLGIAEINVRFFCQVWEEEGGANVAEIDESTKRMAVRMIGSHLYKSQ